MNSFQSFVIIFPVLKKWFNVNICPKWEKTQNVTTHTHTHTYSQTLLVWTFQYITIRSWGEFIQIKLQIVHFIFRAFIIGKILLKNKQEKKNNLIILQCDAQDLCVLQHLAGTYWVSSPVVLHVLCCPHISGRMVPLQVSKSENSLHQMHFRYINCEEITLTRIEQSCFKATSRPVLVPFLMAVVRWNNVDVTQVDV